MIERDREENLASPLRNKIRQLKVFAVFVPVYEAEAPRIGSIPSHIMTFQKILFLRVGFDGRRGKETLKSKVSLTKKSTSKTLAR